MLEWKQMGERKEEEDQGGRTGSKNMRENGTRAEYSLQTRVCRELLLKLGREVS